MHVKTNIEHNIVQVIVLAICPLLIVMQNIHQALFFVLTTIACYLISALVCYVFNKFLSRNLKIFVTALLSTFIITLINQYLKTNSFWKLSSNDQCFFSVLSTIALCIDIYFIETKAVVKRILPKMLADSLLFAAIAFVYVFVIEFLGFGTIFGKSISKFAGNAFFSSITFKLIWLGIVAVIADALYRVYMKHITKKRLTYQKYVKKIRDEKEFQYDDLRRRKLLTSEVEIKKLTGEKLDEVAEKLAENTIEKEKESKEDLEEESKDEKPKKRRKLKLKNKVKKTHKKEFEGDEN